MNRELVEKPRPHADSVRWLQFFPRWSLTVGLVTVTLPIAFVILGQESSDLTIGVEFLDLLQAARNPGMFRILWTLDAFIWLMIGGNLLALSGILRNHAPIRATFIRICAGAQLFGALAGFMRLDGISDLATRYATTTIEQQELILESFRQLGLMINSQSQIGVLCQGAGFILAVWGVFSLRGFPRWLAVWLILPGLLALVQFGLFAVGAPYLRVLNIIGIFAGNIALNFATAVALWRPSTQLISSVMNGSGRN